MILDDGDAAGRPAGASASARVAVFAGTSAGEGAGAEAYTGTGDGVGARAGATDGAGAGVGAGATGDTGAEAGAFESTTGDAACVGATRAEYAALTAEGAGRVPVDEAGDKVAGVDRGWRAAYAAATAEVGADAGGGEDTGTAACPGMAVAGADAGSGRAVLEAYAAATAD